MISGRILVTDDGLSIDGNWIDGLSAAYVDAETETGPLCLFVGYKHACGECDGHGNRSELRRCDWCEHGEAESGAHLHSDDAALLRTWARSQQLAPTADHTQSIADKLIAALRELDAARAEHDVLEQPRAVA